MLVPDDEVETSLPMPDLKQNHAMRVLLNNACGYSENYHVCLNIIRHKRRWMTHATRVCLLFV